MKIRTGFVSNSSSSSYVVFIPDDFSVDYTKIAEEYEDDKYFSIDAFKRMVEYLKMGDDVFKGNEYQEFERLVEELENNDLIIATIEGGPDEGTITSMSKDRITEIYNRFGGEK